MKILITGGAGFIASHLVDALISCGHKVSIVDDLSSGDMVNVNKLANFYKINILDLDQLKTIFEIEKPDLISHHAAQTSVRISEENPLNDASINVVGTLNILNLCLYYNISKIIFASTCAVYSEPCYLPMDEDHPVDPKSIYGLSKLTAENYIRHFSKTSDLKHTIFRYGNVFGPRQNPLGEAGVVSIFTGQMLKGVQPIIFGDGNKTRDYIYIEDIVQANLNVLEDIGNNQTFNLGSGKETSDFEIFSSVRDHVGVNIEPNFANIRKGEARRVCLNIEKANKILKWSPQRSLNKGVLEVVKSFKK
ncbi:MAG: UDP-glucose 4-epimerase [Chloroflexi bacterium]|nr:UDP-glucose 4-epimerase [Chloroflexota bacterium]|tara:strand:- start:6575 stop:7492 length:918 start_codon:yes stop_codon:yes gene_type:complete